ncbi:MAG TPA: HemK/PrmC family methyltransferase [Actinomycetota bacterium]|nr:HemK/PrmC family methyltransferase [Actinomycetota bacterium]
MNGQEVIDEAVDVLEASDAIDHWQPDRERIEAEELLSHLIGTDWRASDEIPPAAISKFRKLVSRRATGEPVPYIKGYAEFRGLELIARPGAFVPRDSTEFLAEQAVRRLRGRKDPVAVDLATGSGPVALAVGNEVPAAEVHGADLHAGPIKVARENARRLGLQRVTFHRGDLFGALPASLRGRIDVITFHPPYVGNKEVRTLPAEVLGFEPLESLTDHSPEGMGLIERAAAEAWDWLRPGGWLLTEVSPDRSRKVATVYRRAGYAEVRSTKGGIAVTRVITAQADRR